MKNHHYRSIFLSDIHLGSRDINHQYLLDFLEHNSCDYLYLVGDIIDLWKLGNGWYWPPINDRIVRHVFDTARRGTRIFYIPGNHDEIFRNYNHGHLNGIKIVLEALHSTLDGRRFLIVHGDQFDPVTTYNQWLAKLGSNAYSLLLILNRYLGQCQRNMGLDYWSLSAFLKHKVKEAVNFVSNFKQVIASHARVRDVDGIICGHIHSASFEDIEEILYINTGDWVESCTALVENHNGKLQLIQWAGKYALLFDEQHCETVHEYENSHSDRRLAAAG